MTRCAWAGTDPLYVSYHDDEWGRPVHDDRRLFEMLILEGAQAGLSWITILRKRPAYRRAFDRFDPKKVARYTAAKKRALLRDPGIVRNRLKIDAAVTNARAFLAVQKEFGSFDALRLAVRRRETAGQPSRDDAGGPGADDGVRRAQQRSQEARLQVRRIHHLLRLHAGRGHGGRSHRGLLLRLAAET